MFRKPQNLSIQGQSAEVNPAINAGPTLDLNAAQGPKRTFQAVDLGSLSQTLNRLGNQRQSVLYDAELKAGVRVQDMIEQGMETDQILKALTGSTPKRLLADIGRRIKNGTLDEVDSPAFKIGFQRRRTEYRFRHAFNEVINNEEQMESWTNQIANSGLGEDGVTAENFIADTRQAIAQELGDLGPEAQDVLGEMMMQSMEVLRQDLNARVKDKVKITDRRLLESKVGGMLDTFSKAVVDADGTVVLDTDSTSALKKNLALLYEEELGRTGDAGKKVGDAVLAQVEEFAQRYGASAAHDILESLYDTRSSNGDLLFDGSETGREMTRQMMRLESRKRREAEDVGINLSARKNAAAAFMIDTPAISDAMTAAMATNDPNQVRKTANDLAVAVDTAEWAQDLTGPEKAMLKDQLIAKGAQRATTTASTSREGVEDIKARARTLRARGLSMADAMAVIENSGSNERDIQIAMSAVAAEDRRNIIDFANNARVRSRIEVLALNNMGLEERPPRGSSKADELMSMIEEISSQRIPDLLGDKDLTSIELDRTKVVNELMKDLESEYPDQRKVIGQLERTELFKGTADDDDVMEVRDTLNNNLQGVKDPNAMDRVLGGQSRESLEQLIANDAPQADAAALFLELDAESRDPERTKAFVFFGEEQAEMPRARMRRVRRSLRDLGKVLDSGLLGETQKPRIVGETLARLGVLSVDSAVALLSADGDELTPEARQQVYNDILATQAGDTDVMGDTLTAGITFPTFEEFNPTLDQGASLDRLDIFAVRFVGFEDAAASIIQTNDGALAYPKLKGKVTREAAVLQTQAKRILEAAGLQTSEDAVLTFLYNQSRLHTSN